MDYYHSHTCVGQQEKINACPVFPVFTCFHFSFLPKEAFLFHLPDTLSWLTYSLYSLSFPHAPSLASSIFFNPSLPPSLLWPLPSPLPFPLLFPLLSLLSTLFSPVIRALHLTDSIYISKNHPAGSRENKTIAEIEMKKEPSIFFLPVKRVTGD